MIVTICFAVCESLLSTRHYCINVPLCCVPLCVVERFNSLLCNADLPFGRHYFAIQVAVRSFVYVNEISVWCDCKSNCDHLLLVTSEKSCVDQNNAIFHSRWLYYSKLLDKYSWTMKCLLECWLMNLRNNEIGVCKTVSFNWCQGLSAVVKSGAGANYC